MKSVVGVKVTEPSAFSTAVPLVLGPTAVIVNASPSTSLSLASSSAAVKVTGTSSWVAPVSSSATGASLTGATLIVTVAVSLPPLPSSIVYWIVVGPLKSAFGVKSRLPSGLIVTVPSGLVADVTVSGSPSASVSLPSTSMPVSGVSSSVESGPSSTASGSVLVELTVIVAVAVLSSPSASATR